MILTRRKLETPPIMNQKFSVGPFGYTLVLESFYHQGLDFV